MSAKRSPEIFYPFRIIGTSFYRRPDRQEIVLHNASSFAAATPRLTLMYQRSAAGLSVLAVATTLLPSPSMAHIPVLPSAASKHPVTLISQGQVVPQTPYTLGPGDRIRLDIFAVPEYTGEYQVLVDGNLNLPVIGSIPVKGLTVKQATDLVSAKYARFVRRPIVTISLLTIHSFQIGVSGEVIHPGSYSIPVSGEGRQYPTLTQAIQLAGGIAQTANLGQVELRRLGANGQRQVYNLNLSELLQTGNLSQDITLRDGDTVFIPAAASLTQKQVRQLTSASFGAQVLAPLNIAVVGEVSRPGTYSVAADNISTSTSSSGNNSNTTSVSKPPNLIKVIVLAGGYTPSADLRSIKVRRFTTDGSEKEIDINLWKLLSEGDVTQDISLQDGDTIIIPTVAKINPSEALQLSSASFAAAAQQNQQPLKVAVVGEVFRPGTYVVTANQTAAGTTAAGATATGTSVGSGSPPTVSKALQGAGGITPLADIRTIEVRRSPRNGIGQVIQVNLWQLLSAGDLTQDVILQDGDTISVPKATNFDPAEASRIAAASFSPTSITVNVVGEVQRPGAVQVPPNTPLNQALLAAGGFNNARAKTDKVDLIRLNPNGTVTKRTIDLDFKQGINDRNNPTIQNNDIILVRRSGLTAFGDTLSTITSPITGIFSTIGIFKSF